MPDRTKLRVGDRIRLLAVPQCDLEQRDREIAAGVFDAGSTANVIERIIAENPVVVINQIDEFGAPWFEVDFIDVEGESSHAISILDDDSWERAR